jgi:hypothetical protein
MSEYRIEKVRRRVSVALSGGVELEGDIFLQPSARYRSGPQDPAELFNEPEAFIPLAIGADESVLLAKDHVTLVQYTDDEADTFIDGSTAGGADRRQAARDDSQGIATGMSVEVVLSDGSLVDGELRHEMRSDRSRLLDFLNGGHQRFLTLRSPAGVCLINWRQIAQMRQRP